MLECKKIIDRRPEYDEYIVVRWGKNYKRAGRFQGINKFPDVNSPEDGNDYIWFNDHAINSVKIDDSLEYLTIN